MSHKGTTIHLHRLQGKVGDIAYELTRVHFSRFRTLQAWKPAVNAYLCARCIRVCVDLAGVSKSAIDLGIRPGLLTIRGERELPEPDCTDDTSMQLLAMEIDHGPFEREIQLPSGVEQDQVTAEQHNGMLWIYLPLRAHA